MKPIFHRTAALHRCTALFLLFTLPCFAQAAEPEKAPEPRRYYSAQRLSRGETLPPLPANPFSELPVYPLDEWNWAYDDRAVDYEQLRSEAAARLTPATVSFDRGAALTMLGECASELLISPGSNCVTLTITNAAADRVFDLFRTFHLTGHSITNSRWQRVASGSNGQSFSLPFGPCDRAFYVLGCTNDTDADGLSDAFEALVGPDWSTNLMLIPDCEGFTLTITNAGLGEDYDLFRTFDPLEISINDAYWYWLGRGSNGQSIALPECACWPVRYFVAVTNDTDADGLTDAYEELVSKTSLATNHSVNALYTDPEMINVLVNSPEEDCGNEQNTQFETTCAVLGSNVIVAYVDSNRGVYSLGTEPQVTNRTPQFVGYSSSTNGGLNFADRGVPPLSIQSTNTTDDDGDVGDPVLAVDQAAQIVYLAGTSPRQAGHNGIPLWKSTDGGVSFGQPIMVRDDILGTDKPWIAMDNGTGTGQHDVYVVCTGRVGTPATNGIWLAISTDASGSSWTNTPLLIAERGTNVTGANSPIIQVGPDHVAYVFWWERACVSTNCTNWLKMRQVRDRGATNGDVHIVRQLVTTTEHNGNLRLLRGNTATNTDFFNAWPFPVVGVNPDTNKAGHLYVAFADRGENTNDKADIFFVCSTNGGTNWTDPVPVNSVWTNDQWMPVLAVKPDGANLFVGWYDRRKDTNNSLIEVYGRWATIDTNGSVTFDAEFRISTVSFPPVFAGTRGEVDPIYKQPGFYDPVYPPGGVNLHWWYEDWPAPPPPPEFDENITGPAYEPHVGEYNGAWGDGSYVYMTWTDSRLPSVGTLYGRNQGDIRLIRLSWP